MAASIDPFIHRKVVILKPDETVVDASKAMCEGRVGSVLVAGKDGGIDGMLTDRDLVCSFIAPRLEDETPVSEVMSRDILSVREGAEIEEVARLMEEHGIRRVPVMSRTEEGRQQCIGIITVEDLIAAKAVDYTHLSKIVKSQIARRRTPGARREGSMTTTETTLSRFQEVISQATGFDRQTALRMSYFVLSSIVRRIHYTGAAHLISLLPRLIQPDLLDLPAGPDRTISAQTIIDGMKARFAIDENRARNTLSSFWEGLTEATSGSGELTEVFDQLPSDIRELLTGGTAPTGLRTAPPEPGREERTGS